MPLSAGVSSIYFLYFGAGAVLCVSIFANYVLHDLGPDEGMYLGASYLAVDQEIYAEFSFFQTPYLPLAISSFFDVPASDTPYCGAASSLTSETGRRHGGWESQVCPSRSPSASN